MAESWDVVQVLESEQDAELTAGFLESQGIPCRVDSSLSHEFPVPVGPLGVVRIEVPRDRAEEARRVLATRGGEGLAEDVDVDAAEVSDEPSPEGWPSR